MKTHERKITLKITKQRTDNGEAFGDDEELPPPGGECGTWYIKIQGGNIYTCRDCVTGYPTAFPYTECIQLP